MKQLSKFIQGIKYIHDGLDFDDDNPDSSET